MVKAIIRSNEHCNLWRYKTVVLFFSKLKEPKETGDLQRDGIKGLCCRVTQTNS